MSRPSHTPPVRRPPLPFAVGSEIAHGIVFMSGGRWMVVASDELAHACYEELRASKHGPDLISTAIGPALLRILPRPASPCPALPSPPEPGLATPSDRLPN